MTCLTTFGFTGQRNEPDLGISYYGARWYDPALSRFLSPDSIIPNPFDPQSYDRYAYTRNNPVNRIDPSGHADADINDGDGFGKICGSNKTCRGYLTQYSNTVHQRMGYTLSRGRRVSPASAHRSPVTTDFGNSGYQLNPGSQVQNENPLREDSLGDYGRMIDALPKIQDALVWGFNNARPVYKHVKGVVTLTPHAEAGLGFITQLMQDMDDPRFSIPQRLFRAGVIAGEDALTDMIATPVGIVTGTAGAFVGGAVTIETGPGAILGTEIGGGIGFALGSWATTQLVDNYIWDPINHYLSPENFP